MLLVLGKDTDVVGAVGGILTVLQLLLWYIGINVFSFLAYGVDKKKAVNNEWRISEKFLLLLSVFGGGIGSFFGMRVFHHKTQKIIFRIWVPLWIVLHIALLLWGNERINFTKQDGGMAVSAIGGADGPTSSLKIKTADIFGTFIKATDHDMTVVKLVGE